MDTLQASARRLKLLALDVDGVLTDGRIYYSDRGEELKSFNIKDGLGIKLLQRDGIEVAIITGRNSPVVQRRADELGITEIVQGREDKLSALRELCAARGIDPADCAYMGDDLPDLAAVSAAGIGFAPADAVPALRAAADHTCTLPGGAGAVREACEFLLSARGSLDSLLGTYA
ncbi:KdsC family phosphatase [Mangrovimicrobium sediminis]|uniref:KdsC family phosphatase n=1 Tax=Mangrovimicrobium sediminis TaxID=2562682 RepID=UPI001980F233|nr:HAD-IIIA family hydrolase [Haliea sp. SAOS-164]